MTELGRQHVETDPLVTIPDQRRLTLPCLLDGHHEIGSGKPRGKGGAVETRGDLVDGHGSTTFEQRHDDEVKKRDLRTPGHVFDARDGDTEVLAVPSCE